MNKKFLIGILGILAMSLVVAVGYYAMITITLNINQPITVNGQEIPIEILQDDIDCDAGDFCLGLQAIKVSNSGDNDREVTITSEIENDKITSEIENDKITSVDYIGKVVLDNKDSNWAIIDDGVEATLYYTVFGDEFGYRLETSEFTEDYVLIYYADQPDRFVEWGGAPALELGILVAGETALEGSVDSGDLPFDTDWNVGEDADYTQLPDLYAHAKGAKIWLIPVSDYNGNNNVLNAWNPTTYLFETDLIYYSNSDKLTIPANSFIEFYQLFDVNQYASGTCNVETTIA